jgi:hypothetical protein
MRFSRILGVLQYLNAENANPSSNFITLLSSFLMAHFFEHT